MRFWADIYDADGINRRPEGPLENLLNMSVTRRLDGAGSASFNLPANDVRAISMLQPERQARLYVEHDGVTRELGRMIIREIGYDAGDTRTFKVSGPDAMDALTRRTVGRNRSYTNEAISVIAADLVSLIPGWTISAEDGLGLQSARFSGTNVLTALIRMAEENDMHIRQGLEPGVLEIGFFGSQVNLLVTNTGGISPELYRNDNLILIDKLTLNRDTKALANRVIPLGAGEGEAALTLANSDRSSPYPIIPALYGSVTERYIQDDESVLAYGVIERYITLKQIGPISNSDTAKRQAANALYDGAAAWLRKNCREIKSYKVSGQKPRTTVRPGDKIRLIYNGGVYRDGMLAEPAAINDFMWVMSVTEKVSSSGLDIDMELNTIDQHIKDTAQEIVGALEAIEVRNVAVQTYGFVYRDGSKDFVQADGAGVGGVNFKAATFVFPIDNDITDITLVRINFKSEPLFATALVTTSGAWSPVYDAIIMKGPNHPNELRLLVNGVDITTEVGGPWGDGTTVIDESIDITQYILEAVGGLYQVHTIEFHASPRNGSVNYSGYSAGASGTLASNGVIQCSFKVIGVGQSILPN